MSLSASLVLSTSRTQVTPGGQVSLTATITSQSPQTEEFRLSLQGIDPAWIRYRPPSVSVRPASNATITMLVRPPTSASSGRLRVIVSLISRRTDSAVAEAVVAIHVGIPGGVQDERESGAAGTIVAMLPRTSSDQVPFWAVAGMLLMLCALLVAAVTVFHPGAAAGADMAGATVGPASWAKTCGGKSTKEASLYAREDVTEIRLSNADQTNVQVLRTEPASILPALFDPLLALSAPENESEARLAYVTAANEMLDNAHVWYIDISDKKKERHKLADVPVGLWTVQPVWSHDNKSLAFVRLNQDLAVQNRTQLELWVVEIGGKPRRIAGLPELKLGQFLDHPVSLCWALDNRTLIFQDLTDVAAQRVQAMSTTTAAAVAASSSAAPRAGTAVVARPTSATEGQRAVAATIAPATSVPGASPAASVTSVPEASTAETSPQPGTPVAVVGSIEIPPTVVAAVAPSPAGTTVTESAPQQIQIDVKTLAVQKVPLQPQATPVPSTDRNPLKPSNPACGVPVFSQNDPAWRYIVMEAGQHYIGSYGCALTSATMIMNYYGTGITPSFLAACLGSNADLLNWVAVAGCTKGQVQFVDRPDFSWQRIDALLATGRPVIVGLVGGPAGMHFIVVTAGAGGGDGANYSVIDPWDASTDKTLRYFTSRGYTPTWLVAYAGSDPNCATRTVAQVPLRAAGPESAPPPAAATALALNANNPSGSSAPGAITTLPVPANNPPPSLPPPPSTAPPVAPLAPSPTIAPVPTTAPAAAAPTPGVVPSAVPTTVAPTITPVQKPVTTMTATGHATSSPGLKPAATPSAPSPSSAPSVPPSPLPSSKPSVSPVAQAVASPSGPPPTAVPVPSAAPTASCPALATPSLVAESVSNALGLTTQIRLTWTATGGCPPVAGTLTARYTYAKQPNERTYHVEQAAPPLIDTPPVPFPGGSFTIAYTLTFYDSRGMSVSTTAQVAVKFAL